MKVWLSYEMNCWVEVDTNTNQVVDVVEDYENLEPSNGYAYVARTASFAPKIEVEQATRIASGDSWKSKWINYKRQEEAENEQA